DRDIFPCTRGILPSRGDRVVARPRGGRGGHRPGGVPPLAAGSAGGGAIAPQLSGRSTPPRPPSPSPWPENGAVLLDRRDARLDPPRERGVRQEALALVGDR